MPTGGDILTTAVAHHWQCDHFGHLNVRNYAALFDDAIFVLWGRYRPFIGDDVIPVTADFSMSFKEEIRAGTIVTTRFDVMRIGTKSVGLTFTLAEQASGQIFATCEVVEVFINKSSRQSAIIPAVLHEQLSSKGGH